MSDSYSVAAYAVFGVRLPADKVSQPRTHVVSRRLGPDQWPDHFRYDPMTGYPLWADVEEPAGPPFEQVARQAGFQVLYATRNLQPVAFVGIIVDAVYGGCNCARIADDCAQLLKRYADLKALLEAAGLWDEALFGLHAVKVETD